jgi:hypothetical protein
MKKFFAILAIVEFSIVILWIITRIITGVAVDDQVVGSQWYWVRYVHTYLQIALLILGYTLTLHYLKPKMRKPKKFFIFITYVFLFGLSVTFKWGSLLAIGCYLKPMPHIMAIILTLLVVTITTYSSKIYRSLTK